MTAILIYLSILIICYKKIRIPEKGWRLTPKLFPSSDVSDFKLYQKNKIGAVSGEFRPKSFIDATRLRKSSRPHPSGERRDSKRTI